MSFGSKERKAIRGLMLDRFPAVWPEDHEWTNVHDGKQTKVESLAALIAQHISAAEIIFLVNYKHGARVSTSEAAGHLAPHVLTGPIQIADPDFKSFVFVAVSGVAAGWKSR